MTGSLIDLHPHSDGIVIFVRAMPGAKQNGVRGTHAGALRVSVTQIAEKGKANRALRDVLARQLKLKRSQVEIISGDTSVNKRVLIREVDAATLGRRIRELL